MSRIALLGPKALVDPLAAAGIDVFPCDSTPESQRTLAALGAGGRHEIVLLTERYAADLSPEIAAGEQQGLNILLIPDHRGSTGLYREQLDQLVRKATGAAL
ncbi:MAG: V-type ATP synthase subunit F [Candidatus Margulisiibacteriota bacterium]